MRRAKTKARRRPETIAVLFPPDIRAWLIKRARSTIPRRTIRWEAEHTIRIGMAERDRREPECDVCGKPSDDLRTVVAYGLETSACPACRGEDPEAGMKRGEVK